MKIDRWHPAAALLAACIAGTAGAQTYPTKHVRLIAAGSVGGSIDFIARIVAQKAAPALGQQMIVDNRGGGGGNIGAELAARAAPDGHTVLVTGASLAINPSIYRRLTYNPATDFAPVTQATSAGYVLVLHPAVPASSLKALIAAAKASTAGINYASPGTGQAQHLGMELLRTSAKFKAIHVPYKGGAPAVQGVASGEADVMLSSLPAALPLLGTARLKAIAVSSRKRMPLLPDVPTIAESGLPGYEVSGWLAFFAPAGTPSAIVEKLAVEIGKALRTPDVQDALKTSGQETVASSPQVFAAYFRSELTKWAQVAKASGARAD